MKKLLCLILVLMMLVPAAFAQPDDNYRNWYEIFVYSYQDSNGDGIGDIPGLISRLDYIRDMGYTGIWLMPVMPSPSYHKYDVTDYCAIDPQYGTIDDFKSLVSECHARDIRIIIDMPINHSSLDHPWFVAAKEALLSGNTDDPHISYYNFANSGASKYVQLENSQWYYEEQFSGGRMPDLNLDCEDVWSEFEQIFEFWLKECDVDGFRLDAVTSFYASDVEKNIEALNRIKAMAEEAKPGSYIVAEAWTGLTAIADYYKSDVDSFFLFPASQAEGYIAKSIRTRKPAAQYADYLSSVYEAIPDGILAPFLANHDTGRAIGSLQARSSLERAKFAETILNMIGGCTFTYYGEEIGMVGSGDDPNKRLAMYWNDGDMTAQPPGVTNIEYAYPCVDDQLADEYSLLNYMKALNHLKLDNPAIARGATEIIFSDAYVCVLKRVWEESTIYIVMNFSPKSAQSYTLEVSGLELGGILDVSEENTSVSFMETGAQIELPPYGVCVLTAK